MDFGGAEVTKDLASGSPRSNKKPRLGTRREHVCVDLAFEILLRLQWSSIGVCKRVCKAWRSIITCPSFMRTYLERENRLGFPHVLIHEPGTNVLSLADVRTGEIIARIGHPDTYSLLGSCNGAILCNRSRDGLLLFNPVSGKSVDIPSPPKEPFLCSKVIKYSLGFDPSMKIFKIMAFDRNFKTCMIFKVGDLSWQPVCGVSCNMDQRSVICFGESLRWIGCKCNEPIWYFDFVEEKFKPISRGKGQNLNEKELENDLEESFLLPIFGKIRGYRNHDGDTKTCLYVLTTNMHSNGKSISQYKIELPTSLPDLLIRRPALVNYGKHIAANKCLVEKLGHIGINAEVYLNKFFFVWFKSSTCYCFYEFNCTAEPSL